MPDAFAPLRALLRRPFRGRRAAALSLIDRIVLALTPAAKRRHGVMILFPHGLGDLVLFTQSLESLRIHYAGEPIVLVCSNDAEGYARTYLRPDRMLAIDRELLVRSIPYRISVIRAIAREQVAVAIQPAYNRLQMVEDALIRASRADVRIGSAGFDAFIAPLQRERSDRWYTRIVRQPAEAMHDLRRNALFVAALTGEDRPATLPRLPVPPRHPSAPDGDYFVVAVEASTPLRTWPAENFVLVIESIARKARLQPIVVGSGQVGPPLANLEAADLRGRTDLDALISLIAHARLVIANDSAPAHLAIALNVPVVAISGGGFPSRYLPYPASMIADDRLRVVTVDDSPWSCFGCSWLCVRMHETTTRATPCIAGIEVAQVTSQALAMLSSSRSA